MSKNDRFCRVREALRGYFTDVSFLDRVLRHLPEETHMQRTVGRFLQNAEVIRYRCDFLQVRRKSAGEKMYSHFRIISVHLEQKSGRS